MITKPIPYGRQHITDEDIQCVIDALKSDYLTQGPKIKEFEERERLAMEKEVLGMYVSGHPLGEYEEELKNNKMIEKVSQEANGLPTFGHLSVDNMFGMDYEAVKPEDIPNFLDESWAIKEKVDDEKDEDK